MNSILFKTHPEWIPDVPPYHQPIGRHQYVLNLALNEVTDYLLSSILELLTRYPGIRYLKCDKNRDLTLPGGKDGRPSIHRQTLALYGLLGKLKEHFPYLEIESCASGGARIDYGILGFACRVWPSDCNDAHERVRIQTGLSYFFPPIILGSHVGPSTADQTKRKLSLNFRCAVALTGAIGVEADLGELSEQELSVLSSWMAIIESLSRSSKSDRWETPVAPEFEPRTRR